MLTVTPPGRETHFLRNGDRCPCTPEGGINVAEFNTHAGVYFNRLMQELRRRYGDIQYARAAEVQKRGTLHFHVLMRVPRLALILGDFDARDPFCALRRLVEHHGFGHEVDLAPAPTNTVWYCAKYVSKSCDDREQLPWLDTETGEVQSRNGRYRPWTASRRWGATMASIRAAQAEWVRSAATTDGEPPQAATTDGEPPQAAAPAGAAVLEPKTHRYTNDGAIGLIERELGGVLVGWRPLP